MEQDPRACAVAPGEIGGTVQCDARGPSAPVPDGIVDPTPGLPPVEEGGTSAGERVDADEGRHRGDRADHLVQRLHEREGGEQAAQPPLAQPPRDRWVPRSVLRVDGEQRLPGRRRIPQARRAAALRRWPDKRDEPLTLERGEQPVRAVDLTQPAQPRDRRGTDQRQQRDESERLPLGGRERARRPP